jgi:hypothetical protein
LQIGISFPPVRAPSGGKPGARGQCADKAPKPRGGALQRGPNDPLATHSLLTLMSYSGVLMKSRSTAVLGLSIVLALSSRLTPAAQQADAGRQADQKIVLGTSEVVLDVVVRDKKGHPVRDLAASAFEVYEDGVKQQIQ